MRLVRITGQSSKRTKAERHVPQRLNVPGRIYCVSSPYIRRGDANLRMTNAGADLSMRPGIVLLACCRHVPMNLKHDPAGVIPELPTLTCVPCLTVGVPTTNSDLGTQALEGPFVSGRRRYANHIRRHWFTVIDSILSASSMGLTYRLSCRSEPTAPNGPRPRYAYCADKTKYPASGRD